MIARADIHHVEQELANRMLAGLIAPRDYIQAAEDAGVDLEASLHLARGLAWCIDLAPMLALRRGALFRTTHLQFYMQRRLALKQTAFGIVAGLTAESSIRAVSRATGLKHSAVTRQVHVIRERLGLPDKPLKSPWHCAALKAAARGRLIKRKSPVEGKPPGQANHAGHLTTLTLGSDVHT